MSKLGTLPSARTFALGAIFCGLLAAGWWFLAETKTEDWTRNAVANPAQETVPAEASSAETSGNNAGDADTAGAADPTPLSAEDSAAIEHVLARVKAVSDLVDLKRGKRLQAIDNEYGRIEQVLLEPPTRGQREPIYTAFREGLKTFAPDSPAAIAFSNRVGEFIADLTKYPVKLATKRLEKADGTVTFRLDYFNEQTVFALGADGELSFSGADAVMAEHDPTAVAYLFPEEAPPQ